MVYLKGIEGIIISGGYKCRNFIFNIEDKDELKKYRRFYCYKIPENLNIYINFVHFKKPDGSIIYWNSICHMYCVRSKMLPWLYELQFEYY